MNLDKTIKNLRKSNESFFNINYECYINLDLYKDKLSVIFDCDNGKVIIYKQTIINKNNKLQREMTYYFVTDEPFFENYYGHIFKNEIKGYDYFNHSHFLVKLKK